MLESILAASAEAGAAVTWQGLLPCSVISLGLGLVAALVYMYRNVYGKSFVMTLVLLPLIVQAVIMLVNGNLGTGIAVLGAFSLVRFRSVPGSAREIGSIFFAMAIGLATGMGYLTFAVLFTALVAVASLLLTALHFGEQQQTEKLLKITIPESLDYTGVFDDLLAQYTKDARLIKVRTTSMGSLYELQYHLFLKQPKQEKVFLDALRCRNGNLDIICGRVPVDKSEL